jgi:hypothetical protein
MFRPFEVLHQQRAVLCASCLCAVGDRYASCLCAVGAGLALNSEVRSAVRCVAVCFRS